MEWVAISFSRGSSQPRDWTQSPTLQLNSLWSEWLGKPEWWNQAQCKDLHQRESTRRTSIHALVPRTRSSTCPGCHLESPRIGSTKHDVEACAELYFTAVQPALIKDSLQTGASHWADFWNGFLFIPRATSRAEGGFMQYRSVGHWQRLTLWQAAWLGWKSRLGLGPSRPRYWIIDRRSLWCKGRANHSLGSIKMKWKPSLKPTLAR